MFMNTLAAGNVQVSGTEGEQKPKLLREKVPLDLYICIYLN